MVHHHVLFNFVTLFQYTHGCLRSTDLVASSSSLLPHVLRVLCHDIPIWHPALVPSVNLSSVVRLGIRFVYWSLQHPMDTLSSENFTPAKSIPILKQTF